MWPDSARERCRDEGRYNPSNLTDAQWPTIKPVLRGHTTLKGDLEGPVDAVMDRHWDRLLTSGAGLFRMVA